MTLNTIMIDRNHVNLPKT